MAEKKRIKHGRLIKQAVLMAEELFPEPKSGKLKRDFVVTFINERVNLPWLNERQEERILTFAIDCLCDVLFAKLK